MVDIREAALGKKTAHTEFEVAKSTRQGVPDSPWVPGTSAAGHVKRFGIVPELRRLAKKILGVNNREYIPVKMVRLDSDLGFCPDVVKLDLGGGEIDALRGMSEFLPGIKVIKFETELLTNHFKLADRGGLAIQTIRNADFVFFVDDLQFCIPKVSEELRAALSGFGVEIVKELRLVPSEPDVTIIGRWPDDRPLPISDIKLTEELADLLASWDAKYFQVDLIALNSRYSKEWTRILPSELFHQAAG